MNFNKPKQQVIDDAYYAAQSRLQSEFNNIRYGLSNNSASSNLDMIGNAISLAIKEAIESIVLDTYTDQEFEEDIKLRT